MKMSKFALAAVSHVAASARRIAAAGARPISETNVRR